MAANNAPARDWLRPGPQESDLRRYLRTLRERRWLIAITVLLTTLAAIVYLAQANKVYKAETDMLVSPVSGSDPVMAGLPLIRESSDPARDVETATRLIVNIRVARAVATSLHASATPKSLLEKVDASPIATSNIVAVTAKAGTPIAAARLANAFATQSVAVRTSELHDMLDSQISALKARAASTPNAPATGTAATTVQQQLAELETLRAAPVPDLRVQTLATPPSSPASPRTALSLGAGILGGLILGVAAAFTLEAIDPRLRREDQLRSSYSLPILARIPDEDDGPTGGWRRRLRHLQSPDRRSEPRTPDRLSPFALEAYRTLRATLHASRGPRGGGRGARQRGRAIMITSASPWEGKTTTAINLAESLAHSGATVILLEADLRRPAIGRALDMEPRWDTADVLRGDVDVEQALVSSRRYCERLRLLLADPGEHGLAALVDGLFQPMAGQILSRARELADVVVVDSPPIADVIDGLPIAQRVDDVVIVARLGVTHLGRLRALAEVFAQAGIEPAGFAVVGATVPRSRATRMYYEALRPSFDDVHSPLGPVPVPAPTKTRGTRKVATTKEDRAQSADPAEEPTPLRRRRSRASSQQNP